MIRFIILVSILFAVASNCFWYADDGQLSIHPSNPHQGMEAGYLTLILEPAHRRSHRVMLNFRSITTSLPATCPHSDRVMLNFSSNTMSPRANTTYERLEPMHPHSDRVMMNFGSNTWSPGANTTYQRLEPTHSHSNRLIPNNHSNTTSSKASTMYQCLDPKYPCSNGVMRDFRFNTMSLRENIKYQYLESSFHYVNRAVLNICSNANGLRVKAKSQLFSILISMMANNSTKKATNPFYLFLREYLHRTIPKMLHLILLSYVDSTYDRPAWICQTLSIKLRRHLMRKHDYINLLDKMPLPSCQYCVIFFIYAYPFHCAALQGICKGYATSIKFWMFQHLWYELEHSIHSNRPLAGDLKQYWLVSPLNLLRRSLYSLYYRKCPTKGNTSTQSCHKGGGKFQLTFEALRNYILPGNDPLLTGDNTKFKFVSHVVRAEAIKLAEKNSKLLLCRLPLSTIANCLTAGQAKMILKTHGVYIAYRSPLPAMINHLIEHQCSKHCYDFIFVFKPILTTSEKKKNYINIRRSTKQNIKNYKQRKSAENKKAYVSKKIHRFPPSPPNKALLQKIVSGFCKDTHPSQFEEAGCAVCGKLTLQKDLISLQKVTCSLDCLKRSGVTSLERHVLSDDKLEITGPIIDPGCKSICPSCHKYVKAGICPPMALANGLWLGQVPEELTGLTFAETILIARIRHNRCLVRVASGRRKMKANAISFQNPISKIYDILPPPIEELDDVLACIFTGPCQPTEKDVERTPMLVRRNKVGKALQWLILNHIDYQNVEISDNNLNKYPLKGTPIVIDYRQSIINKDKEATSLYDNEEEEGVETGKCSFVVHGLTGDEYSKMTLESIKAKALEHLMSNGKIAFIGHAQEPESIYNNPQLFPSMMPWLFPYGLGGVCNKQHQGRLSSLAHKRHLLMYHDKRFQMDPSFALIALNHEQIKECTTGGYLTAEKAHFSDVANRLHNIDLDVLSDISRRLSQNIRVSPETEAEKSCYKLLKDLDIVGGHVKGSIASKKYMRNEIWSLISSIGAPSWFITLSPADNKHPICLYFADIQEEFKPDIRLPAEAYTLVANNPVAAARFFNFMCETFIKHVLGIGQNHPGLFGKTSAYYGTVEQQGRLTLHLHLLIWIENALSPQEIRDNIMDSSSDFQKQMVEYLEGVHQGEFFNGQLSDIHKQVDMQKDNIKYTDPTQTMPEPPPPPCSEVHKQDKCKKCKDCNQLENWWSRFKNTVDDLVFRSNVHSCKSTMKDKNGIDIRKGCQNAKGQCRARFPREVVKETMVDPLTGALRVKKGEAWINMFTPIITYLFRCNSDTTSLLSGTTIKAIVAYVSDYITKPGLTTYSMFDTIRHIFNRNSELIGGSSDKKKVARMLITKIVNALTAKMEIGSPMASLYLLGNPDHYTGHKFVTFYWKNYVQEVQSAWNTENKNDSEKPAKVILNNNSGEVVGLSNVHDYIHRPYIYHDMNLWDWIRQSKKSKRSKEQQKEFNDELVEQESEDCYDPDMLNDDEDNDELDILHEHYKDKSSHSERNFSLKGGGIQSSDYINHEFKDEEDNETDYDLNLGDNNMQHIYEDDSVGHNFLKFHPQFKTHHIKCTDDKKFIPNIVGGSLPRCDQGDREYYCLTMLTFFKPWRTGKDLKNINQSWDEVFNKHRFTIHQLQLMNNFNLRYECNDARDDFSAKIKKDSAEVGFLPSWASADIIEKLDQQNNLDYDNEADPDDNIEESIYLDPSSAYLKKLADMNDMENVVQNAGWLEPCPDKIDKIDPKGFVPSMSLSGSKWKGVVKKAKDAVIQEKEKHLPVNEDGIPLSAHNFNDVVIDDISYIKNNFKADMAEKQSFIDNTVKEFNLNTEQERAFRIVANHATMSQPKQLKMYLGGMGGTGKSQVIKALTSFFAKRNESHRIIVLAPTGSAAALLNGSTYHSVLGINSTQNKENIRNEHTTVAQVKARLNGVDYIFLDEISMVACHELYLISASLSKARNIADAPFGGVNMIFAGDFAQLPPVGAPSLYQETVGTSVDAAQTLRGQQSAIGKALWHQVTTVVILRQNMRQKSQTSDDAKLRTALENMRYAACTPDDIKFLRSRIAGKRTDQPNLASKQFRNVSIITTFNVHKDRINEIGSERFAAETGQKLTHFYSIDTFGEENDPAIEKKRMRKKRIQNHGEINPILRNILWNLGPAATDHVSGKLSLCIGLPVMIRNNDATELCITKGQEGHVAGWQSAVGPNGQLVLDTLFVKLDNPAKTIQLEGLPDNVVPLTKSSKTINCVTPSGLALRINRSQVSVLPNFAMTDYASQGKTRLVNVVDINNSRDHRSFYTVLSRSASSKNTVIIQGFNERKITCGASGYLRQEFRELELLNEITKLIYNNTLPNHINGNLRNPLIRQFQIYKSSKYVPCEMPSQLKWTSSNPMDILPIVTDSPWQIISNKKKSDANKNDIEQTTNAIKTSNSHTFVAAKGTVVLDNEFAKAKRKADEELLLPKKKKLKQSVIPSQISPVGLIWEQKNYSCAYDAIFTILYDIWKHDISKWTILFNQLSKPMETFVTNCKLVSDNKIAPETARDNVRQLIYNLNKRLFPYGQVGTNIEDLARILMVNSQSTCFAQIECTNCNIRTVLQPNPENLMQIMSSDLNSISNWFKNWQKQSHGICNICQQPQHITRGFAVPPELLIFSLSVTQMAISKTIKVENKNRKANILPLKGIVYIGNFHFTSRIISEKDVWFHDGMTTKRDCQNEGNITNFTDKTLMTQGQNMAVLVIYAKNR